MAIRTENYMLGERQFTRTWSDTNHYVVRDGISYSEANDPTEFGRTYIEGDLMPEEEWTLPQATVEDYENALIDLGVHI